MTAKPPKKPRASARETTQEPPTVSAHHQARILAEVLPHLIRYDDQTVVIKFGGHAMGDQKLADAFVFELPSGANRRIMDVSMPPCLRKPRFTCPQCPV